jgi:hypothetical protein
VVFRLGFKCNTSGKSQLRISPSKRYVVRSLAPCYTLFFSPISYQLAQHAVDV